MALLAVVWIAIEAIKSALNGARIEIPYPHTTLTFDDALRTVPENTDQVAQEQAADKRNSSADDTGDKPQQGDTRRP